MRDASSRRFFGKPFTLLYRRWTLLRLNKQVVRQVSPGLWEDVRRKMPSASAAELAAYAEVRAGQVVHAQVDQLLKTTPLLDGIAANQLIVAAAREAVRVVLETARKASGRARRKAA